MRWEFKTEAFRDPPEVLAETDNGIHGHVLAHMLKGGLDAWRVTCDEPWAEDHGWAFQAYGRSKWLITTSLATDDGMGSARSLAPMAFVTLMKSRSLLDRILGRGPARSDEDVPRLVAEMLAGQPGLRMVE